MGTHIQSRLMSSSRSETVITTSAAFQHLLSEVVDEALSSGFLICNMAGYKVVCALLLALLVVATFAEASSESGEWTDLHARVTF
jgi:hypothetical protein